MTNSENYWQDRIDDIFDRIYNSRKIKKTYKQSLLRMESDIKYFYKLLTQAGKPLTRTQLYEYTQFIQIRRQLRKECGYIRTNVNKEITDAIQQAYIETFGNLEYLMKGNIDFSIINPKKLKTVVNRKIEGKHFSERIWGNTNELAKDIEKGIIDSVILGNDEEDFISLLRDKYNVSYNRADTLVMTELQHTMNKTSLDTLKDLGRKKGKWLTEKDSRVCEICQTWGAKGLMPIEQLPTLIHPRCRCTPIGEIPNYSDKDLMQMEAETDRLLKKYKEGGRMN